MTRGLVMVSARFGADLGGYKNVQAWSARCNARPALARAMMG